jgi:hypothetical protein
MPFPLVAMAVGAGVGAMAGAWVNRPRAGQFDATVASGEGTETLTADEIYRRVHGGVGLGPLVEAGVSAQLLESRYADRATQIATLRGQMATAWEGGAADASFAHTQPLLDAFEQSRDLLYDSGQPLSSQIDAFGEVFRKVQEVAAEPPRSNLLNDVNPFHTDTDAAIAEYNAKASTNVQAYLEYNAASTDNGGRVPQQYPTLPAGGMPPVVVQRSGTAGYGTTTLPGTGPAGAIPTATVDPSAQPARSGGLPTQAGPPVPDRSTTAQSFVPEPNAARGVTPTPPGPGPAGPGPGAAPLVSPVTGGYATGSRPGAGGGVGGRNAAGPRPGSGAGPRPGPGGANPAGQTGRPASPATGPRAGAASPGGMPGPAGRSKGDEDAEHKNKYTTSPDPNALFGTDELYVNPVIGDDR